MKKLFVAALLPLATVVSFAVPAHAEPSSASVPTLTTITADPICIGIKPFAFCPWGQAA